MFKETSFTTKNPRRAIHWRVQDACSLSSRSARITKHPSWRQSNARHPSSSLNSTTITSTKSTSAKSKVNARIRQLAQPTGQDPANRVFRLCIPKLAGTAQSLKSRSWRRQPFVKVEQDPLPLREARSSPL